jgi:hypothetical protein
MTRKPGNPRPSVLGDLKPSAEGLAYAGQVWAELGYVESLDIQSSHRAE